MVRLGQAEPRGLTQPPDRTDHVHPLRPIIRGRDRESRWVVAQSDGGTRLVALLSARTARSVVIDAALLDKRLIVERQVPVR